MPRPNRKLSGAAESSHPCHELADGDLLDLRMTVVSPFLRFLRKHLPFQDESSLLVFLVGLVREVLQSSDSRRAPKCFKAIPDRSDRRGIR